MKSRLNILRLAYISLLVYIRNKLSLHYPKIISSLPQKIIIIPTLRCNLECKHCYISSEDRAGSELSTSQWINLLKQLNDWLGECSLHITGGEPFLRKDVLEIIKYAVSKNIFTSVFTNGMLIDENNINSIIESGLSIIYISIDGVADVHDSLRGPGSFDKAIKALELLKGRLRVNIAVTITSLNIDGIADLLDFCKRQKLEVSFQPFIYVLDEHKYLWPSDKNKVQDCFNYILDRKKRGGDYISDSLHYLEFLKNVYLDGVVVKGGKCLAYQNNFNVWPDGAVYICKDYPSIGNVLTQDPKSIWSSEVGLAVKERIRNCARDCLHFPRHYPFRLLDNIPRFFKYFFTKT